MDVIEAIRHRKSIRSFKPKPVPKETLADILRVAVRCPSCMNTQPWGIVVVGGKAIDEIKRGNIEALKAGKTPMGELPLRPFDAPYRQRQVDLAVDLFKLMGITREDKQGRASWSERGYRFFDAPAGIILTIDKALDNEPMSLLDMGAIMQTICLVAEQHGLSTCIEDQAVMFPEVVRKVTGVPETKRIAIGIAIGYADDSFPANKIATGREPIENVTTWCGF